MGLMNSAGRMVAKSNSAAPTTKSLKSAGSAFGGSSHFRDIEKGNRIKGNPTRGNQKGTSLPK